MSEGTVCVGLGYAVFFDYFTISRGNGRFG